MPSFVIADHCEGGSCPVLEHIKDTGDEVAKDFLPYLGAGVILAHYDANRKQSKLTFNFKS